MQHRYLNCPRCYPGATEAPREWPRHEAIAEHTGIIVGWQLIGIFVGSLLGHPILAVLVAAAATIITEEQKLRHLNSDQR